MERWEEIFKGVIPAGNYQTKVENGEENGLLISLESDKYICSIECGIVSAFRMLDEGLIMDELFNDDEVLKYKNTNFSNTIYKIENGEFREFVEKINKSVNEYLELTHYLIITMNYVIEVMSQWEPNINVYKK